MDCHKGAESAFEWFECEYSVFVTEEEEWMDDDFSFSPFQPLRGY